MRKNIKVIVGLSLITTVVSISTVYANNQEGIVTATTLNIRTGPSTSYKAINQVKKNNRLEIIEQSKGWYKVILPNGKVGWGSGQYINTNENDSNNIVSMQGQKGQIKVSSNLNVRSGPSTSYSIVSKLKNDETVDLLEKANGWFKIKLSNGNRGWSSSDHIAVYNGASNDTDNNTNNSTEQSSKAQAIVEKAHEQLGKSYVWGAEGPNSFDCSGLVHHVYGENGIKTPRVSRDQYKVGGSVSKSNLQPGDLIFSSTDSSRRVTHVGIYVGDGKMIHAPNSKGVVKKVDMNTNYWNSVFVGAKRIL